MEVNSGGDSQEMRQGVPNTPDKEIQNRGLRMILGGNGHESVAHKGARGGGAKRGGGVNSGGDNQEMGQRVPSTPRK